MGDIPPKYGHFRILKFPLIRWENYHDGGIMMMGVYLDGLGNDNSTYDLMGVS